MKVGFVGTVECAARAHVNSSALYACHIALCAVIYLLKGTTRTWIVTIVIQKVIPARAAVAMAAVELTSATSSVTRMAQVVSGVGEVSIWTYGLAGVVPNSVI